MEWVVIYEPPPDPPGVVTVGANRESHMRVEIEGATARKAVEAAIEARPSWGDPNAWGAEPSLWAVPMGALTAVRVQRRYELS